MLLALFTEVVVLDLSSGRFAVFARVRQQNQYHQYHLPPSVDGYWMETHGQGVQKPPDVAGWCWWLPVSCLRSWEGTFRLYAGGQLDLASSLGNPSLCKE